MTDHKTGKNRTEATTTINGGKTLQPVLYSLVVEAMTGETVSAGRLYYCTEAGKFTAHTVHLEEARQHNRRTDYGSAERLLRELLARVPQEHTRLRADLASVLGFSYWGQGRLDAAIGCYREQTALFAA